jgi:hypothetical protein
MRMGLGEGSPRAALIIGGKRGPGVISVGQHFGGEVI